MSEKVIKLLVPVDFSGEAEKAYPVALFMARLYKAEVHLLHVLEVPAGIAKLFSNTDENAARKEVSKRLDEVIASLPSDVIFRKMIKLGRPTAKILEAAVELDANCIIMGTNGASGIQEMVSGSNTSKVIKHAPCPVISLRNQPGEVLFNKILLPIDLTKETGEKLKLGIEFAKTFNAELTLLTILENNDEESKQRLNKRLKMALDLVRKQKVSVESSTLILKGDISKQVIQFAEEIGADLIAIMTQQELAFRETLLGSNASHLVNHSPIPVLSIRPEKEYREVRFESAIFG